MTLSQVPLCFIRQKGQVPNTLNTTSKVNIINRHKIQICDMDLVAIWSTDVLPFVFGLMESYDVCLT